MTKIWFAHDGVDPTTTEPKYVRPLQECVGRLGLAPGQRLCGLDQAPVINEKSPRPQDYQHVICRVDHQEASEQDWEAAFYRLRMRPKEVAKLLERPEVG